jgi:pimeloyl-ACP methyl ester carboxylesterase
MQTEKDLQKPTPAYTLEHIRSADGTTIGYRHLGQGPGVILVHGGMMAAQNFMELGTALSDSFSVYIPDRRGRGTSGPHGPDYCLARECEDIQALVEQTGAQNLFGLSSGAIVALQTALILPDTIRRLAVYEPPLAVNGTKPAGWSPRFERELARGDLGAAMITVIKGTGDTSILNWAPRFLLVPFMRFAVEAERREAKAGEVPIKELIPTMHFDTQLVFETEEQIERYRLVRAQVLLLGGSQSHKYLRTALDALEVTLPDAKRVELLGVGHVAAANGGQPERVAQELRQFFLSGR